MNSRIFLFSLICIIVQSINWAVADAETGFEPAQTQTELSPKGVVGTYSVKMRGFDVGQLQTTVTHVANKYNIRTKTLPNRMVSLFIESEQTDQCVFNVVDGFTIEPESYQSVRTGDGSYNETIDYDLDKMTVSYSDGSDAEIPLGYVLDNCNFYFAVAKSNGEGAIAHQVKVFDAKEHRTRAFKTFSIKPAVIGTNFGKLNTKQISMIRTDAKDRTIKFWLSDQFPLFPIRIEDERNGKVTLLTLEEVDEI